MVVVLGRVVVDEVEVDVVDSGIVDVVVVDDDVVVGGMVVVVDGSIDVKVELDVVVVATADRVNAESGTITQPALSIFQANIKQAAPPFSYIQTLNAFEPGWSVKLPDIIHEQPWSFQLPHSALPICIRPPSSVANMNSIVVCAGISMKPTILTMNWSPVQLPNGSPS